MRKLGIGFMALLSIAACGGSSTDTTAGTPATSAPVATAVPTPAPIMVTLNAVGDSGVTGTGEIVKSTGGFTVTMKLKGLAPSSNHVNHIHNGSCTANGGIAIALQPLAADASGAATATSTISQEFTVPAAGWYLNVHTGPDLQGANAKPIACGNVASS